MLCVEQSLQCIIYILQRLPVFIDSNRQREWSILIFAQAAKHFQSTTFIGTNKKERGKWTNLKAFLCFVCYDIFSFSSFPKKKFCLCVCSAMDPFPRCRLWYEVLYNNGKWCAFCSNLRQLLGITGMCGYILKIAENFVAMYYIKWIKVTLLPWLCARMLEQILKLVWKWTAFPLLIYFFFSFFFIKRGLKKEFKEMKDNGVVVNGNLLSPLELIRPFGFL